MKQFLRGLRILPRWIIILIDLSIITLSVLFAYLLRFNFNVYQVLGSNVEIGILVFLGIGITLIFITQMYAGIIRYTSLQDGWRITYTVLMIMGIILGINLTWNYYYDRSLIPYSIINTV